MKKSEKIANKNKQTIVPRDLYTDALNDFNVIVIIVKSMIAKVAVAISTAIQQVAVEKLVSQMIMSFFYQK